MQRNGLFRYRADVRPVVLICVTFALSLVPFVLEMPGWALAAWVGVLVYIKSYGPYAQHNHAHLATFNSAWANWLYNILLAQTTGYQTSLWELHHGRGHHRHFLTPEKDVARIIDLKTGQVMSRWAYAFWGNLTIHRDAVRIGRAERAEGKKSLLGKLATEIAVQAVIVAALIAWNPLMAMLCFVGPALLMSWMIWWESYQHHLDVPGTDFYDGSVTVTGADFNHLNFNIGHHTAHHEKPTLHWSLLPQRTEAIRARIHESCLRETRGPGTLSRSGEAEGLLPEWVGA